MTDEINGIKEGVNVDYHTIMNKKNFNYSDWYEEMMNEKGWRFEMPEPILIELHKKRNFGIKKYGNKSFQHSFETSMTSPIKQHAKEELIDELNYLLHLHFVVSTNGSNKSISDASKIIKAISFTKDILNILDNLETV